MQQKKKNTNGGFCASENAQISCDGCGLAVDPGREPVMEWKGKLFCVWCWDNNCCGITAGRNQ